MSFKTYERTCKNCGVKITYYSYNSYYMAVKRNSNCDSCRRNNLKGDRNPFFGKHHTSSTKEKISKFNSEERVLSDDFIQKAKENLAKVTNDRPLYDIWIEKYGKEIADQKILEFKIKQSKNNSGVNNPMFGKPSPQGSGNGWSGWYKDWYFRSLRELSYMINIIEKQNFTWQTPDKEYKILYKDYKGITRTYFPDFIINENKIVEIKPQKLHNTPKVSAKRIAAEDFCHSRGMTYEIVDPPILSNEEIKKLYISEKIVFLDRYKEKFEERFMKNAESDSLCGDTGMR